MIDTDTIKRHIHDLHSIVSIEDKDDAFIINCIVFNVKQTSKFSPFRKTIKKSLLKPEIRESIIDDILNSKLETEFDVESIIYTDDQMEKIKKLRSPPAELLKSLVKAKKEYTEKFKVGDRVYYKNNPGIITFKHSDKNELDPTKFSVKVKDTEFRYVCGLELVERKKQDLSDIEIDPNLNKLSTEKLLKMYRRQRGNRYIKRILEEREHIQREEQKTIIIK